jgi:hypothetical protein
MKSIARLSTQLSSLFVKVLKANKISHETQKILLLMFGGAMIVELFLVTEAVLLLAVLYFK